MDNLSDTQIRADLRSVLAEAGIDIGKASIICAGGVVRLLGQLLGTRHGEPVRPGQLDALEQSIKRTRGVRRVHFHLKNWERQTNGKWAQVGRKSPRGSTPLD